MQSTCAVNPPTAIDLLQFLGAVIRAAGYNGLIVAAWRSSKALNQAYEWYFVNKLPGPGGGWELGWNRSSFLPQSESLQPFSLMNIYSGSESERGWSGNSQFLATLARLWLQGGRVSVWSTTNDCFPYWSTCQSSSFTTSCHVFYETSQISSSLSARVRN